MTAETLLEAIATQRERHEAEWLAAGRLGRRFLILAALARADDEPNRHGVIRWGSYLLAQDVARLLSLTGTRRHGRGAVAGSYSGYRAAALRVVPGLRALESDGFVYGRYQDGVRLRRMYRISVAGRRYLEAHQEATRES